MAWANNDDELLILSDDSDVWSDFVLDEQIVNDNNSSINDMISFDTWLGNTDIKLDSIQAEDKLVNDNSNDFSFSMDQNLDSSLSNLDNNENNLNLVWETSDSSDFSFSIDSSSEKPSLTEEKPFSLNETDFSFWDDLNKQNESLPKNNNENSEIWTMTDIIDEAISKFLKREDLIWKDIESRETNVDSLKNEISELEKRVSLENDEISRLNTEKQAILKNRKSLEKMKEIPVNVK